MYYFTCPIIKEICTIYMFIPAVQQEKINEHEQDGYDKPCNCKKHNLRTLLFR